MIKKNESTTNFINDFEKIVQERLKDASPQWLKDIRSASLTRFTHLGVPTINDEEWRYTNLKPMLENTYSVESKLELNETEAYNDYVSKNEILLVFVNGLFSSERSQLASIPPGVTISTLDMALKNDAAGVEALLTKYNTDEASTFVSLNNAFSNNGAFIKVEKNTVIEELIHIVHVTSSSNGETLSLPRAFISMGESSEATILESHVSFSDTITYFANALTDIHLEENATLHYCKAQKESLKAFHIGNTRVWQEKNSNLIGFSFMAGAAITRNNLDIVLNGEGIQSTLNGLYSPYADMHVDNHTNVDHRFPHCTSNQLYKGILNDSSRAVFNGKIFVQPIAQQTNSYQLNKNLLLGEGCRVDTKPQLEIYADDVKCSHGATVGQLDKDELFYLQSRCIGKKDAVKLLSKGFVEELINTITHDEIDRKLHILLKPSFDRL